MRSQHTIVFSSGEENSVTIASEESSEESDTLQERQGARRRTGAHLVTNSEEDTSESKKMTRIRVMFTQGDRTPTISSDATALRARVRMLKLSQTLKQKQAKSQTWNQESSLIWIQKTHRLRD